MKFDDNTLLKGIGKKTIKTLFKVDVPNVKDLLHSDKCTTHQTMI